MKSKEREEVVVGAFEKVLLRRLQAIRIVEGGTKAARSHIHIFVPGEVYGGKYGSMLCKKGYKEWQAFKGSFLEVDICPKCGKKLAALIGELSRRHASDLLAIAAGTALPDNFSDKEIDEALRAIATREYYKQKDKKAAQEKPLEMFSAEETHVTVVKTQPFAFAREPQ